MEVAAAEKDTKLSGFAFQDFEGTWHNRFASTQAGLLEMSLKVVLGKFGFTDAEIHELTRKEEPEGEGKGKEGGGWQQEGKGNSSAAGSIAAVGRAAAASRAAAGSRRARAKRAAAGSIAAVCEFRCFDARSIAAF